MCAAHLRAKGLSLPRIGKLIGCAHSSVQRTLLPAAERVQYAGLKKIAIGLAPEPKGRAA